MVRSKLSDEETEVILGLVVRGSHMGVLKYVNKLLHEKGMGTDTCARPWAIRNKKELERPCFAIGYLDRVVDFMTEVNARQPKLVVSQTKKYVEKLKSEIELFFTKES